MAHPLGDSLLIVSSGLGFSFWGILLGRFFAGVGSAGIAVLVSTLIVGECARTMMKMNHLADLKQTSYPSARWPSGEATSTA